jgi:gliding motility-associated-like protein
VSCVPFHLKTEFKDCIGCKIFVPNAFSPNDDRLNDVLKAYSSCPIEEYQLQVFNRWGQNVFETKNIGTGWDGNFNGKKQPNGVYIYCLRYKNSGSEKNYKTAKGTVVIIR